MGANKEHLHQDIQNLDFLSGLLKKIADGELTYMQCAAQYGIPYMNLYRLLESAGRIVSGANPQNILRDFTGYMLGTYEQLYVMIFGLEPNDFGSVSLPPDFRESMDFILSENLADREKDILVRRAGGESLQKIADAYGLTRERIRVIIRKALDKLRTHKCIGILQEGIHAYTKKRDAEEAAFKAAMEAYGDSTWLKEQFEKQIADALGVEAAYANALEVLNLSARPHRILTEIGCESILDIYRLITDGGMAEIHGLGGKSVNEIQDKYKAYMQRIGAPEMFWRDIKKYCKKHSGESLGPAVGGNGGTI